MVEAQTTYVIDFIVCIWGVSILACLAVCVFGIIAIEGWLKLIAAQLGVKEAIEKLKEM